VKIGYPRQGGGPRALTALAGVLAASAFACSAAGAQLPEPPTLDPASLPTDPVEAAVNEPLPEPAESVVENSPVAPVREQVQQLVGGATQGQDPGGASPGASEQAPSAAASGSAGSNGSQPAGGGSVTPSEGGASVQGPVSGGAARRAGSAPTRTGGDPAPAGRRGSRAASRADRRDRAAPPAARRRATENHPRDGRVTETLRRIVAVVPDEVWIALAVLGALALALGARTLVERRRVRALAREREQLLRDVGLLERALLPEVPDRLGGLACSVSYRPADGPAAGGDFNDAFELPDGRAAVLVGDVSGHGREALERTNSMRSRLHDCLDAGMSPQAALESAGRAAAADRSGGFTTVVVAVHDPDAGTLTYAAAGHPPPIIVGPDSYEPITAASAPPLGLGIRTGQRQTTVPLTRGSTACLFTDGLFEARADGEQLGLERLDEIVAKLGPDERADALIERVIAEADETPDDMTACLLRAVEDSGPVAGRLELLELEADELEHGAAERLLEACGVPAGARAAAVEGMRATAGRAGRARLEVTIGDSTASVSVTASTGEELLAAAPAPARQLAG
jgi:Stage II sporulation protein E (SpoIIE)